MSSERATDSTQDTTGKMKFCTEIDIDALDYGALESQRSGQKTVRVSTVTGSTNWDDQMQFSMSRSEKDRQTTTWGLSAPMPGAESMKRSMDLVIETPEVLEFLQRLDEKNKQMAVSQSQTWFRKSLDEDAVEQMYTPLVKKGAKENMKPTVKVKVQVSGDRPTPITVMEWGEGNTLNHREGGPDDIVRNSKCIVHIKTSGLWFMSRSFGMSFNVTSMLVWKPRVMSKGIDAFTFSKGIQLKEQPAVCEKKDNEEASHWIGDKRKEREFAEDDGERGEETKKGCLTGGD